MKTPIIFLIFTAIFFLAFSNRASADFHFNDPHFDSHGDHHHDHDKDDHGKGHDDHHGDRDDHHHHHHHSDGGPGLGGGGGNGPGGHSHGGLAPEPVSPVLFLFGAGLLSLRYFRRKQAQPLKSS